MIGGNVDPNGFVVDYAELARWWEPMFAKLDHHYLNDIPGLEIPSTEHLAAWISVRLLAHLARQGEGLVLERVVVHESSTTWCSVHPLQISPADMRRLDPESYVDPKAPAAYTGNPCTDYAPHWYTKHWREYHRGHRCDKDPDVLSPEFTPTASPR